MQSGNQNRSGRKRRLKLEKDGDMRCSRCKPHRGENARRKARPDKYKDMPECVSFSGSVTRCEPPHVLAHTWVFDNESSEVCYELAVVADKVRLVLTHTRLNNAEMMLSVSGGWHAHLEILIDVLDGTEPQPFWSLHTELESKYEALLKPGA